MLEINMKKVMVFGTFDIFHPGHEFYLKKAKKYGDLLEVVVAKDSTVRELKGKEPLNDELKRLSVIKALDYVDRAYLGYEEDKYKIIEEVKPDVICLGYDQYYFTNNLKEELKKRKIKAKIIRLKSYKEYLYKSSKLRK